MDPGGGDIGPNPVAAYLMGTQHVPKRPIHSPQPLSLAGDGRSPSSPGERRCTRRTRVSRPAPERRQRRENSPDCLGGEIVQRQARNDHVVLRLLGGGSRSPSRTPGHAGRPTEGRGRSGKPCRRRSAKLALSLDQVEPVFRPQGAYNMASDGAGARTDLQDLLGGTILADVSGQCGRQPPSAGQNRPSRVEVPPELPEEQAVFRQSARHGKMVLGKRGPAPSPRTRSDVARRRGVATVPVPLFPDTWE